MWCRETLCCDMCKNEGRNCFSLWQDTRHSSCFSQTNRMCGHLYRSDSTKNQDPKRAMKMYLFMRQKWMPWVVCSQRQHSEGRRSGEESSGRSQALKDQHCVISYPEGETEVPTEIATDAHPQTLICMKVNNLGWVKAVTFLQFCHSWLLSLIIFRLSFTSQEICIQEMFQTGLFFRTLDRGSKYLFSQLQFSSGINYIWDLKQITCHLKFSSPCAKLKVNKSDLSGQIMVRIWWHYLCKAQYL